MAKISDIQLYYSTTPGAVPDATDLLPGELAINTADGKLFYEDTAGVVQELGLSSLADLGITATANELNVLDGITASTTELNYTDGVTSNIQTQLNTKIAATNYATSTTGGTVKARLNGTTAYFTINGSNA
mgnify:CR=1 FL=1